MKNKIIFFSILLTVFSSAFSLDNDPLIKQILRSLNYGTSFNVKNGHLGEYVLLKDPVYSDNKLSYLEWQIKNELCAGIDITGNVKNVEFSLGGNFGFPQNSGIVMDSDWLNNSTANVTATSGYDYKTNYSESDNLIDYDFKISLKAEWKFEVKSWILILPGIGFDYSQIKFTAKDGWASYGKDFFNGEETEFYYPWNDSSNNWHPTLSGTVLEYKREQTFIWFGTDFKFTPINKLCINIGTWIAPYTYTFNEDKHPLNEQIYVDICTGWFSAWNFTLDAGYKINSHLYVGANFDYFILTQITGKSYQKSYSDTTYQYLTAQNGGADAKIYSFGLNVKVKI